MGSQGYLLIYRLNMGGVWGVEKNNVLGNPLMVAWEATALPLGNTRAVSQIIHCAPLLCQNPIVIKYNTVEGKAVQ